MISAQTKRIVRSRYVMRCGYCGVSEQNVGGMLTYDHFKPRVKAGLDTRENIVYSCHSCNEYKGDYWEEDDKARLLHPLNDDLSLHVREDHDGRKTALSDLGAVYIARLQLNRPALIAHREEKMLIRLAVAESAQQGELLARIWNKLQRKSRARPARRRKKSEL